MNLDLCHLQIHHNATLRERRFRLCGIFVCLFSFFRPVRFGECQPLSDYPNLLLKYLKAGLKLFNVFNSADMRLSFVFNFGPGPPKPRQ